MRLPRQALLYVVVSLLLLPAAHSQGVGPLPVPSTASTITYPNSAEGLRLLLDDVVAAAMDSDRSRLETLVREMEIPDYKEWFTKTYGQEKGESWAEPYGRNLAKNEDDFQEMFTEFAREDGAIITRSVNESPNPGRGLEWGMLQSMKQQVDMYFANWKKKGSPQDASGLSIGYFVFVDGKFRWDSTISFMRFQPLGGPPNVVPQGAFPPQNVGGNPEGPSRPGSHGVGFPACEYCPSPEYPKKDKAKHIEGMVVLQVVVQPDGHASDIKVVKTPDQDFADKAVEAVSNWRFRPALGPNGDPVATVVPIEVTFRLLK